MLAGAHGRPAYQRRDGENSVPSTSASRYWSARRFADCASLRLRGLACLLTRFVWRSGAVATVLPTWCVASQIRGLAWPPDAVRLDPARRAGAARLAGGARALRGPATRRHRHTRRSLRARQPTVRGGEQARGSTRPCRLPKRAQRAGRLRPPWRPQGRPGLPERSVRAAQHPPARELSPQPAGMRFVRALGVDARPPGQPWGRTYRLATRGDRPAS